MSVYDSTDLKKAHLLSYITFQLVHEAQPEEQEEGRFCAQVRKANRLSVVKDPSRRLKIIIKTVFFIPSLQKVKKLHAFDSHACGH